MYKDVLKKFGVKIFIVVCSVLLLGGAAIAAPRIKADKPSLGEYKLVAADVEYKYKIDENTRRPVAELAFPSKVTIQQPDGTPVETVSVSQELGSDYYIHVDNEENAKGIKSVTATVTILTDNTPYAKDSEQTVTYNIIKAGPLDWYKAEVSGENGNRWNASSWGNNSFNISRNQVKISATNDNGEEIVLTEDDLQILSSITSSGPGEVKFPVSFSCFEGSMEASFEAWKTLQSQDLIVKLKSSQDADYHDITEAGYKAKQGEKPDIQILDKATGIDITEYCNCSFDGIDGIKPTILIRGKTSKKCDTNPAGGITFNYTNDGDNTFDLQFLEEDKVVEYDIHRNGAGPGTGYINLPLSMNNNGDANKPIATLNTDYTIDTSKIKFGGSPSGIVEIVFQGIGDYQGYSCTRHYNVIRPISDAVPEIIDDWSKYQYNGSATWYKPAYEVRFNDLNDALVENTDFTTTFYNERTQKNNDFKNAGTIAITITGTGDEATGGYYGSKTIKYEIKPWPINKDANSQGYYLSLDGQSYGPNADPVRYIYNGNTPNVAENAQIFYQNGNSNLDVSDMIEKNPNGYDIIYYVKNGNGWTKLRTNDPPVQSGSYKVEFQFNGKSGNYDGSVEAEFEIYMPSLEECQTVEVTGCSCGYENGEHVYDGNSHELKFAVKYKLSDQNQTLVDLTSFYNLQYKREDGSDDHTNVGKVEVSIHNKTNDDDHDELPSFEILPLNLEDVEITLPESDFKPVTNEVYYTHSYVGKNKIPSLETVNVTYKDKKLVLKKGDDYKEPQVLYIGSNPASEQTYPMSDKQYRYLIETNNSNFINRGYTSDFKLDRKPIKDDTIKFELKDMDFSEYRDDDSLSQYIKDRLTIYDEEFKNSDNPDGEKLEIGRDYTVDESSIKNNVDVNGTAEVTIKECAGGCYKGNKVIKFNVGNNIADAELRFSDTTEYIQKLEDGPRITGKKFEQNGNDVGYGYKNLTFVSEPNEGREDKVSIVYVSSDQLEQVPLYFGKNYTVSYGAISYEDNGTKKIGKAIITGKNGYYGSFQMSFEVVQTYIDDSYTFEIENQGKFTYTGSEIQPKVLSIKKGDVTLNENDYTVDWTDNIDAGTGYIVIKGKNNYSTTDPNGYKVPFTINPQPLDDDVHVRISFENDEGGRNEPAFPYIYGGVCPKVIIEFNPNGFTNNGGVTQTLVEETDYKVQYANNEKVWIKGTNDPLEQPCAVITSLNKNFFASEDENETEVLKYFSINPLDINNCEAILDFGTTDHVFTGKKKEPVVSKLYYPNSETEVDQSEYEIEVNTNADQNIYVGMGSITIIPKTGGSGNFTGKKICSFNIIGDLNPVDGTLASKNSRLVYKTKTVKYGETDNAAFITNVEFQQKKAVDPPENQEWIDPIHTQTMKEGTDYIIEGKPDTVGVHSIRITAKEEGLFKNSKAIPVAVLGDLSEDYTTYTGMDKDEIVVTYTSGQSLALQDLIAPVYCGGKRLVYGDDYKFNVDQLETRPGTYDVYIQPTQTAIDKGYLTGERLVRYSVKTDVKDAEIVGVKDEYVYDHGDAVISDSNIEVWITGIKLEPEEYDIAYEGDIQNCTEKGGKVVITAKGAYKGTIEKSFTIVPYDLGEGAKDGKIKVDYDKSTIYTGAEVLPTVNKVTAEKKNGDFKELAKGDEAAETEIHAEYEIAAGANDTENWTRDPSKKPTVLIRGSGPNYTGSIELEYTINRQKITSENVVFGPINDQSYKNGKPVTPIPSAAYFTKDLAGILYDSTVDYANYADLTKHFTYEYKVSDKIPDFKNVGQKEICIRGIGNFYGETTLAYNVIPKDIGDADVELTITDNSPEYNGREQCPAFRLTYDGDVILTYTGKEIMGSYMKTPVQMQFTNAMDVTSDAQVTITPAKEDTNYIGSKVIKFSIKPASITDHIQFLYHPVGVEDGTVNLSSYKLNMKFNKGHTVKPEFGQKAALTEGQVGVFYNNKKNANHGALLLADDYTVEYRYVQPGTDEDAVRPEYQSPEPELSYAGKVKVTITGQGNYKDSAAFWYYIGRDISADATIRLRDSSVVYNAQVQAPVEIVSGVRAGEYTIVKYRDRVDNANIITDNDFVNVGEYYVCVDGSPMNGTYSSAPQTMTYTITARTLSKDVVIDGFKKEYAYTGRAICPVGIAVTDYINNIKYKLTEGLDYTLSYANNTNAGTAVINVTARGNYQGSASAQFAIISSAISSGGNVPNGSFMNGNGEISGADAISPDDVKLTMDTNDAMYYTGRALYPGVSIANMTENVDYTVTYSNNTEIGTGVITIQGIGNNTGMIKKYFRIIVSLSDCTIAPIPDQDYTGTEVKPVVTIMCGNKILSEGVDYTLSYTNNIEIGTGTVMARAVANGYFTGSASANFNIGNNARSFVITGYASSCVYSGEAVTPEVIVESGNMVLTRGVDYTLSYADNTNAGLASITVTGTGRFEGTQTVNFVIEPKSISTCTTTEVEDKVYTGDAYTPPVTVSDNSKELTNGADYTVTYTNNTNPGTASIIIEAANTNYAGTKVINFQIEGVPVESVRASSVKYSSMNLSWEKQDYADGYQICDAQSRVIESVTANNTKLTGLAAGTTYRYKIRSYILNPDGSRFYSTFSQVVSATTKLEAPTVKLTSPKKSQARIKWSRVSGADGYELYYKRTKSATYQKVKTINNRNTRICNVKGLKSKKKCYLRVKAFKNSGSKKIYSTMSKAKTIKVK